jgi:hypothetical protein
MSRAIYSWNIYNNIYMSIYLHILISLSGW